YFTARIPNLRIGDRVQYGALCACGNVEVPQPGPPHVFHSSFHVVGSDQAHATHPAAHAALQASVHAAAAPVLHAAQAVAHGGGPAPHQGTNGAPPHHTGSSGHGSHVVEGTITSPGRGPLAGVLVEIIDKNPGPHATLATATTDAKGHYRASYSPPG